MTGLKIVFLRSALVVCLAGPAMPLGAVYGQSSVARHDLTPAEFQSSFAALANQGYRLKSISGYTRGGQELFAVLWVKAAGPAWTARYSLSSPGYQAAFDDLRGQGYRLIYVSGYPVRNQARFAAIWEKSAGPTQVTRHDLTAAQYQNTYDELKRAGFRLLHVSGYAVRGQNLYAAIWEKSAGPTQVARHDLSSAQYQSTYDEMKRAGFRLRQLSGYTRGGQDLYAAVWENSPGPPSEARHRLTSAEYQRTFTELAARGYRLKSVSVYKVGGEDRYAALWEKTAASR
jgi:hypothetical protein